MHFRTLHFFVCASTSISYIIPFHYSIFTVHFRNYVIITLYNIEIAIVYISTTGFSTGSKVCIAHVIRFVLFLIFKSTTGCMVRTVLDLQIYYRLHGSYCSSDLLQVLVCILCIVLDLRVLCVCR